MRQVNYVTAGERMDNRTKVSVDVTDNGSTRRLVKDAKELKATYDQAAQSGSRAAAAGGSATTAKLKSMTDDRQYGIARGAVGTGASARDFAKEARGLGGVVRLYATFAANLFAVSTAFGALKQAADTTNMVKGLNDLGASSGRNLGNISKRLTEITDGAVSMRQAMETTAQTMAAGMSTENLEKLVSGARNVSQVMGVSLPDSLNRLSRGISKMEPELLDELGIFVRVDDAANEYAKTVGKTAAQLTDFERRGAFATSVLTQLEQKYGAIQAVANPYDQLLASLKDLGQTGLELVNKVIEPLVGFLSESPTGLASALALVGISLAKQVFPEIGHMREQLKATAEEARTIANKKLVEADKARKAEYDRIKLMSDAAAQSEAEAVERAHVRITKIRDKSFKASERAFKILSQAIHTDVSKDDISYLKELGKSDKRYLDAAKALEKWVSAEQKHIKVVKQGEEALTKQASAWTTIGQTQMIASRANAQAMTREINSIATQTASVEGLASGWRKLNEEIKLARKSGQKIEIQVPVFDEKGNAVLDEHQRQITQTEVITTKRMGIMRAGWTRLTGAISIATGAATTFLNAMGIWVTIAAAVATGISFLVDKLSATTKETKATGDAIDAVQGSMDNMSRTMDVINKKPFLEQLSIESLSARANALKDMADSLSNLAQKASKELSSMNGLDSFIDGIRNIVSPLSLGLIDENVQSKTAETFAKGLLQGLDAINSSEAKTKTQAAITKLLGGVNLSIQEVSKSLDSMSKEKFSKTILEISTAVEELSKQAQVAAAKGEELKKAYKISGDALTKIINAAMPKDDFAALGTSIIETSKKLTLALNEPTQTMNAMLETISSAKNLTIFPPEMAQQLLELSAGVKKLNTDIGLNSDLIQNYPQKLQTLTNELSVLKDTYTLAVNTGKKGMLPTIEAEMRGVLKQISALKSSRDIAIKIVADLEARKEGYTEEFKKAAKEAFLYGSNLFQSKLEAAWAKVMTPVDSTVAGLLQGTEVGVRMQAEIQDRAIAAEIESAKLRQGEIVALEKLTLAMERTRIATERSSAKASGDNKKVESLDKEQEAIDYRLKQLNDTKVTLKEAAKAAYDGVAGAMEAYSVLQRLDASKLQISQLEAQRLANTIKMQVDLVKAKNAADLKDIEVLKAKKTSELASLEAMKSLGLAMSQMQFDRINQLKEELGQLDTKSESMKLAVDLAILELAYKHAGNASDKQAIRAQIDKNNAQRSSIIAANTEQAKIERIVALTKERVAREREMRDILVETASIREKTAQQMQDSAMRLREIELDTKEKTGQLSESDAINKKAGLEIDKASLATKKEINVENENFNKSEEEFFRRISGESDVAQKQLLIDQQNAAREQHQNKLDNINSETEAQKKAINEVKDYALLNTKLNTTLADSVYDAIFHGGSKASFDVRKVLEEQFRKPVTMVIKAFMAPISQAIERIMSDATAAFSGKAGGTDSLLTGLEKMFLGTNGIGDLLSKSIVSAVKYVAGDGAANTASSMLDLGSGGIGNIAMGKAGSFFAGSQLYSALSSGYKIGNGELIGGLSKVGSLVFGPIAGAIGGLLNRAFGKKLADQGIEGNFSGNSFSGNNYAFYRGGWFSSDSTKTSAMDRGLQSQLGMAFGSAKQGIAEYSNALNGNTEAVLGYSKRIKMSRPTTASLTAELEAMQETMATLALGTTSYNKLGETSVDALQRLVSSLQAANSSFELLGMTTMDVSIAGAAKASEFVDAFGSAEAMVSASSFVFENFFTEQEQLTKVTDQTRKVFAKFGKDLPDTREQYLDMVTAVRNSGDAVQYAALMQLAPSMDTIIKKVEEAAAAVESQFKQITSSILEMTLSAEDFKLIDRADILSQLEPTVRGLKQYEFALQDVKAAQDAATEAGNAVVKAQEDYEAALNKQRQDQISVLTDQAGALTDNITAMRNYAKSLRDFKRSLLLDSVSPLTPAQKYAEAKSQFDAILSVATGTAVTEQEKAAKDRALSQLDSAASALLDNSKIYNASSSKYATDFTYVQDALEKAAYSADSQASTDDLMLQDLKTQISLLEAINNSTASTAAALQALNEANLTYNAATDAVTSAQSAAGALQYNSGMSSEQILKTASDILEQFKDNNLSYTDLTAKAAEMYGIDPTNFANTVSTSAYESMRNKVSGATSAVTIAAAAGTPLDDSGRVRTYAAGGLASGIALVGEVGPELVDFRSPGRVYTAEQTRGMFTGGSNQFGNLANELRNLREEVAKLRQQQQEETGQLITATYDSQSRNAAEVTTAMRDSANKNTLANTSKEMAKLA